MESLTLFLQHCSSVLQHGYSCFQGNPGPKGEKGKIGMPGYDGSRGTKVESLYSSGYVFVVVIKSANFQFSKAMLPSLNDLTVDGTLNTNKQTKAIFV